MAFQSIGFPVLAAVLVAYSTAVGAVRPGAIVTIPADVSRPVLSARDGFRPRAKDARVAFETEARGVHSTDVTAGTEWVHLGPAPKDEHLELLFAVKQQNTDALEKALLEVSDPSHPRYGRHLSNDQVHDLVAPAAPHLRTVQSFLEQHGVAWQSATPNSDLIQATVPIAVAEVLLHAQYHSFRHAGSNRTVHRCLPSGYSLPPAVAAALDLVAPTVHLPAVRAPAARAPAGPADGAAGAGEAEAEAEAGLGGLFNTPSSLKKLYSTGAARGSATGNKMAVTAFLEQYYSEGSLQEFYALFCGGKKADSRCGRGGDAKATVATKGDAGAHPGSGTESMLDVEYITAMGVGVPAEFWGFSGRSPNNANNEPFLKWLQLLSNTTDAAAPRLFSSSYGEDETSLSLAWARRLNTEFQKAGARGISLLFSSGDSGAASDRGTCPGGRFVAQWPSGSPWVTAVGGTQGGGPESAAGLSSGGFSSRWPRPSYQAGAVARYLASGGLPAASKFNHTGRGFPDISAQAVNFVIVSGGIPLPGVAGTSCASPTASGVIALLNDLRMQQGKPSLGFLNPFVYQQMDAWNDVSSGSNGGCGLFSGGFPAKEGWDAATGVGTPNYGKLAKAVDALP